MASYSPEWHSESALYYPDDIDEIINTEKIQNIDEHEKSMKRPNTQQQFLAVVQDFIKGQRPENT